MVSQVTLSEQLSEYYGKYTSGTDSKGRILTKLTRKQPPRTSISSDKRGTDCFNDDQIEEMFYNTLLRPDPSRPNQTSYLTTNPEFFPLKYLFIDDSELQLINDRWFIDSRAILNSYRVTDDGTPASIQQVKDIRDQARDRDILDISILKYGIANKIPILGTILIEKGYVAHNLAYMLRVKKDSPTIELFLFETYNTTNSGFLNRDARWEALLIPYFMKRIKDPSILYRDLLTDSNIAFLNTLQYYYYSSIIKVIPIGVDLQKGVTQEMCVMWSFVFLTYLRDLKSYELRNFDRIRFKRIYDDIRYILKQKDGYAEIMAKVHGSLIAGTRFTRFTRLRKTRKNRIRTTHNVQREKSRKSLSGIRRYI